MNVAGFLVEEFLEAVSAQLDRTQDALAAKAKVRPMTFALRDFAIDLQVFVSMDADGNIRLRSAAPGETGSSTLKLEFTTITRPMIEENTVSLAMAQAPTLTEVGLKPEETRQLERFGVRTVAQLQALRASGAGIDGIARLTEGLVPADRLREALRRGRPQLFQVVAVPQTAPSPPAPSSPVVSAQPTPTPAPTPEPVLEPAPSAPILQVPPGATRLHLLGRNLLGDGTAPQIKLGGEPLETAAAEDDRLVVKLPPQVRSGALEIELGDDEPVRYDLHVEGDGNGRPGDPWAPEFPR
jgi:hypothetical protein